MEGKRLGLAKAKGGRKLPKIGKEILNYRWLQGCNRLGSGPKPTLMQIHRQFFTELDPKFSHN